MSSFSNIEIIPAIIPQSLEGLRQTIGRLRGCGANTIQIDVTDGVFVASRSWPMNRGDMKSFEPLVFGDEGLPYWNEFNFEVDLMVHHPEKFLLQWIQAGVTRAVIHIGSEHNLAECRKIAASDIEIGIAVDLDAEYSDIAPSLEGMSYVQVMGIAELGKQGEPFDERALVLIQKLKKDFPDVTIQVDGGVSDLSAPDLIASGAERLVSGSFILESENPKEALRTLSQTQ